MRLASVTLALLLVCGAARGQSVLAAFTVLGPDGAVARAVVDGAACPALTVDGRAVAMAVRVPADARFPLVCDALLPAGAAVARLGERALPVPKASIARIALFGDSGCRVDARSGEFQSCLDPDAWPFARTSVLAAAEHPDLVIHVGDYLYRESPCPAGYAGCAGSPAGDNWASWQADFFTPAAPLLRAAPWVMVRGNHENCNRAGLGFFRLLDPRPMPAACPHISAVYRVNARALVFFVLDSGEANDVTAPDDLAAVYRAQFAGIDAPPGAWLLTHRPMWGVVRIKNAAGLSMLVNDNTTLQVASGNFLPRGIALVLSGHIHLFEALGFADHRAPQLILGTAGSSLSDDIATPLEGHEIGGTTIAFGRTAHVFGVTEMTPSAQGWSVVLHDAKDAVRFRCALAAGAVSCTP